MKDKYKWVVQEPKLSRTRRLLSRYEDVAPGDLLSDCKANYRQPYFEALDLAVNAIEDRFDQPDYQTYRQFEELLMDTVHVKDILTSICNFYGKEFDNSKLQLHLRPCKPPFSSTKSKTYTLHDIEKFIANISVTEHSLIN